MSSYQNEYLTSVTENDMITVKSDLVLISEDEPDHKCQKNNSGRHKVPNFHIDPEDDRKEEGFCHPSSALSKTVSACLKLLCLTLLLYFFVTSLDLLSSAFRLIGGRTASAVFQQSALLSNPVVGLMIGVLVTVIVQSSSTSSSIVVSMVAANFLDVKTAIPIIMGANIGTSLTNTLVSFGQINDREQFERAFAGATIHDMFNWLSVIVMLPIEVATDYLYILTQSILSGINFEQKDVKIELLSKLTKPFTNKIVQLEKKVLDSWSMNDESYANATLLKLYCVGEVDGNNTCDHLAAFIGLNDFGTGLLLLFLSICVLCFCLIGIVRILSSFLKGSVASVIQKFVNADLPYVPFLTGYLALLIGAVMTFLLQSSSIFTSSLTPLIGLGVIKLERAYPLTLGSNLGTTTTALLASLTADSRRLKPAIQVALVHMFFNINGILLFYPIPFMRFPIGMSKSLAKLTAKHRWFSVIYIILSFIILPGLVFSVSLGGSIALMSVFIPLILFIIIIISINVMQNKFSRYLPVVLHNWEWCPRFLRSLEPIEEAVGRICCNKTSKDTNYLPVQGTTKVTKDVS